ncbi:hypothetical protein ACVPPR_00390 [Dellaglioa sp. L3N]
MINSNHSNTYSVYMFTTSIFLGLLLFFSVTSSTQASSKSSGAYAPPDQYPLGAATGVTAFAGGSITFDVNQIQSLQGQYFAKDFKSTGYGAAAIQDYSADNLNDSDTATYDKMNPSMVSDTVSGGLLRMYANAKSFRYSATKNLTFFIEHPPTDAELTSTAQLDATGIKRFHEVEDNADTLADFPGMVKNKVTSFKDAAPNLRKVSDYYADFTSTTVSKTGEVSGKNALYNDAISSLDINTDHIVKNPSDWNNGNVIQLNIDMNKKSTKQGVIVVDINGDIDHFQSATDISINLLNFASGTTKMPYIILNYKNFTSFDFTGAAWMHITGYAPLKDDATYTTDKSDTAFKGQNTSGTNTKGIDLAATDTTVNSGSGTIKTLYNTSSHVLHNFNTENTKLSFGVTTGNGFTGSVLAPNADIDLNANSGSNGSPLVGSLISGQDIVGNMSINDEVANDAGFNSGDFDVAGTDDDPAGFLENGDTNTTKPTIQSATVSGNNSFIPGPTKTLNWSVNRTSATVKQDNASLGADASTLQTLEKNYKTVLNINPNDQTYYLWYRLNNGKWQKYAKNYTDASSLTDANETFSSKTNTIDFDSGNAITALEDQYQDTAHKYDRTAYSDKKTYSMNSNDSDQIDEDYELIGYHLYHKNKISYLITATDDDTINKVLDSSDQSISDANLTEKDPDYTPISYQLNVTGNLLVTYPKDFDFGTYKLGESKLTDKKSLPASGTLTIDNPFKVNWDLTVNTNDSAANDPLNPLFKEDRLSWYKQVQTSKDGDALTFEEKPATSNKIDFSSSKPIFELPSSGLDSSSSSVINKSYYNAKLTLDFATSDFDKPGTYHYNSLWEIAPTTDSGIIDATKRSK